MTAIITDLSELPLLLKLMSVCPLPDLDLEDLFRELRASLLLSISDLTGSHEELEFQSALALQCFTNEYIYNQSEHEDEALAVLEMAVKQVLNKANNQARSQYYAWPLIGLLISMNGLARCSLPMKLKTSSQGRL